MTTESDIPAEGISSLPQGLLERLVSVLGRDLLGFITNMGPDSLAVDDVPASTIVALEALGKLLLVGSEQQVDSGPLAEFLKHRLTEFHGEDPPLAVGMHHACGGVVTLPEVSDELQRLTALIAFYSYPSFLLKLPADYPIPRRVGMISPYVMGNLLQSVWAKRFEAELLKDDKIASVFSKTAESIGRYRLLMTSTGRGGSLQSNQVAIHILNSAWRDASLSASEFMSLALETLQCARDALTKQSTDIRAQIALTGVTFPSQGVYDFPGLRLRSSASPDHDNVPDDLVGQLAAVDANGTNTAANYAGDVIAEFSVPYQIRTSKASIGEPWEPWSDSLLSSRPVEDVSIRLRMALILAIQREYRVQAAVSWQRVDDPLFGPLKSWSTPQDFFAVLPATLTEEEVASWAHWYAMLSEPNALRISLAVSRIVRASGERRDPVDVLIDSVIAWENMFGVPEGEATLRVTASLALLLESEPEHRQDLQTELKKIYTLRSKVVHGSTTPRPSEMQLCNRALDVAILAARRMLSDRTDLLGESDVGRRSLRLMFGPKGVN